MLKHREEEGSLKYDKFTMGGKVMGFSVPRGSMSSITESDGSTGHGRNHEIQGGKKLDMRKYDRGLKTHGSSHM